jgi:Ala-tRNA(Pro) deacylase
MATRRTVEFLEGLNADYSILDHAPACTAQEVAAAAHIPGRCMAKTVVVKIDGELALAVVPADREVAMALLRTASGAVQVELAEQADFAQRFEGCQLGAEPPLGVLFGMQTYVDKELAAQEYVAFNAGSRTEVITMKFTTYRRIARPHLLNISVPSVPGFIPERVSQL